MKKTLKWKIAQQAEWRWWKRYLKGKDPSSYLHWKRNYWNTLWGPVTPLLSLPAGSRLADVGCGPAGLFMVTGKYATTAIDPLLGQYEQLGSFFRRADYPHVTFISMPFESFETIEPFDVICCLNALNHFSDLPVSLDKLTRFLKPGGFLLLSVDAHNHSFFKHLFRLIPGDILHPHQYSLEEYLGMMEKRNFLCIRQECLKKEYFFNHELLLFQLAGNTGN